jgi:hypothetical protein
VAPSIFTWINVRSTAEHNNSLSRHHGVDYYDTCFRANRVGNTDELAQSREQPSEPAGYLFHFHPLRGFLERVKLDESKASWCTYTDGSTQCSVKTTYHTQFLSPCSLAALLLMKRKTGINMKLPHKHWIQLSNKRSQVIHITCHTPVGINQSSFSRWQMYRNMPGDPCMCDTLLFVHVDVVEWHHGSLPQYAKFVDYW